MSDVDIIVGVWEVHAPDAPFPWHVMTFTSDGVMQQSNPHEGNQAESDSSGHGVWHVTEFSDELVHIAGKFVEFKADRKAGTYIGKGEIYFKFAVHGDHFDGTSEAYRYDASGKCIRGPLTSPVHGTRVTYTEPEITNSKQRDTHMSIELSEYAKGAPVDALNELFHQMGARAAEMAAIPGGEAFISLAVGAPDNKMLRPEFEAELHDMAKQKYGAPRLNYRFTDFEPTAREFFGARGISFDDVTDLQLTSGGMNAITLGVSAITNHGDTVLAEAPGFTGTLSVLQQAGCRVVQIASDGESGVTPKTVEEAFKKYRPKLIALMPDFQNPTGAVMPLEARKAIAKLAQKYGVAIVEDGAYRELRYDGEALPTLQSLAPDYVLHATSLSKITFPAGRIGCLIGPKHVLDATRRIHFNNQMVTSPLDAAAATCFLGSPELVASRLTELRDEYRRRRDAMLGALTLAFPEGSGYSWTKPAGGMFVWFTAPETVNLDDYFKPALANGVGFVPGSTAYAPGNEAPHNTARLNFASSSPGDNREGIRRLAATLAQ